MFSDHRIHHGHTRKHGNAMGMDRFDDLVCMEPREKDHCTSCRNGKVLTGGLTVGVEKWDGTQEDLLPFTKIRGPVSALQCIDDHITVREHHAFGCSRRSTGILQLREIGRSYERQIGGIICAVYRVDAQEFEEIIYGWGFFDGNPTFVYPSLDGIEEFLEEGEIVLNAGDDDPLGERRRFPHCSNARVE